MSRCKACNEIMTFDELRRKNTHGEYEELCTACLMPITNDIADSLPEDDVLFDEVPPWDEEENPKW